MRCGRCSGTDFRMDFKVKMQYEDRPMGGSSPKFEGIDVVCKQCGRNDPFTPKQLEELIRQALAGDSAVR